MPSSDTQFQKGHSGRPKGAKNKLAKTYLKDLYAIYLEGGKEIFYVKRFLIENPDREEMIITDHPKSHLEKVFVDYRPLAEIVFVKERGKDRKDNIEIDLEEFIAVKGISAMGNQLTKDKVLEINELEPLPYDAPQEIRPEEIEVIDMEAVTGEFEKDLKKSVKAPKKAKDADPPATGEKGQTNLF